VTRAGRLLGGAVTLAAIGVAVTAVRVATPAPTATPMLIFTQVPVDDSGWSGAEGNAPWFPDRSRIVALDPHGKGGIRVLTAEFHSARAAFVSPDGKRMVFAGRRQASDPWQVWEMQLNGGHPRLLTSQPGWYTDPAYLGDGRVILSGRTETNGDGFALYTTAGASLKRVTFHPEQDLASQVLPDGQVVFVSGGRYLISRDDGTGLRLFYQGADGSPASGRAWETEDGTVLVVERGRLVGFSEKRPLHSRAELSGRVPGLFHSLSPLPSGALVVSYRPPNGKRYALYQFDPTDQRLQPLPGDDPAYHAVEPVVAAPRARPKAFYSVVDSSFRTGGLYCLNANASSLPAAGGAPASAGRRLRVLGRDGLVGEVPLAADGSFYIELPGDVPVRFETVDGQGRLVRGPSAWLWVRPNEHRGCVGCHQSQELAPDNRVPEALLGEPVTLPLPNARAAGASPP
jgi:hypothetical protein